MNSGRILVVAPDDDLRRSVTFALVAYGHTVAAERDWSSLAAGADFDCVVLDEQALATGTAALVPFLRSGKPVLLLAYSPEALANADVTGVVAMPLAGDAVIQAVAAALAAHAAAAK